MSLKQRLDKLARTPQAGRCSFCAKHNPLRQFVMEDPNEHPPAWPGPDDPRACPRCGRRLGYFSIVLHPNAHPPSRLGVEVVG
jgi:hypothetical protein